MGNRLSADKKQAFMDDLAQDAYRMIIKKPLKKEKDSEKRQLLFQRAQESLKSYFEKGILTQSLFSAFQKIHIYFVLHGYKRISYCLTYLK